jgi:hypothetical protein
VIERLEIAAGAALVAATFASLVGTLVLPRRGSRSAAEQKYLSDQANYVSDKTQRRKSRARVASSRMATVIWRGSHRVFFWVDSAVLRLVSLWCRLRGVPLPLERVNELRHRILGPLGPAALLLLFLVWAGTLWMGYGLILWPLLGHFGSALVMSASSITTLGFAMPTTVGSRVVVLLEGATGIVVVALQISFLFTLYGHYSARERLMRVLEGRAGHPALGPELLWRELDVGALDTLGPFYSEWEAWAAEVTESHLAYPWLLLFRSSDAMQSWVVSLLAVLDSAALYHALAPKGKFAGEADHCLRMGFTAFREVALILGVRVNFDPRPEGGIQLPKDEFMHRIHELLEKGFPAERRPGDAWLHFQGWRVNYEAIAYELVERLAAVPAEWTGASSPIEARRPRHRKPGVAAEAF